MVLLKGTFKRTIKCTIKRTFKGTIFMARRKISESHIRMLGKKGEHTFYLTLPRRIINKLKWRTRQKLVVTQRGKGILIKDWKKT